METGISKTLKFIDMKRLGSVVVALAMMACAATSVSAKGGFRHGHKHMGQYDLYTITDGMGVSFSYVHSAYRISDWATDEVRKSDGLDGFNIGVTKDFPIYENMLFLQPGVVYTYLNDSRNMAVLGGRVVGDWNEHYLSIPLKLKYEVPVMDRLCVFATAGPTLVGGVSSSMKYRARINDSVNAALSYNVYSGKVRTNDAMSEALKADISSQLPAARYRRADLQLGLSAGVRFSEFLEGQIGYDWGIGNRYKDETLDDLKMRRQQFYITVGVRF